MGFFILKLKQKRSGERTARSDYTGCGFADKSKAGEGVSEIANFTPFSRYQKTTEEEKITGRGGGKLFHRWDIEISYFDRRRPPV